MPVSSRAVCLALAACSPFPACANPHERTLVVHGATVTTAIGQSLAVVAEGLDPQGKVVATAYGMLGAGGGTTTVGAALPADHRVRLQFGVDADIWLLQDGHAREVQSHHLAGLRGANVEGKLELRNATTAASMTMPSSKTFVVSLRDGMLHVAVQ